MEGHPWAEFKRGNPISPNTLARELKCFGIQPQDVRIGDKNAKGYHLEVFKDAFSRYPPGSNRDTVTTPANIDESTPTNRDKRNECHGLDTQKTPANIDLSRCHGSNEGAGDAELLEEIHKDLDS